MAGNTFLRGSCSMIYFKIAVFDFIHVRMSLWPQLWPVTEKMYSFPGERLWKVCFFSVLGRITSSAAPPPTGRQETFQFCTSFRRPFHEILKNGKIKNTFNHPGSAVQNWRIWPLMSDCARLRYHRRSRMVSKRRAFVFQS